jgi:hypothetical protein
MSTFEPVIVRASPPQNTRSPNLAVAADAVNAASRPHVNIAQKF